MVKKTLPVAAILIISLLHYLTPIPFHHFHAVYQRLYYIPIIMSAYWFGLRIGLLYALLAGASYAPHIFFQWSFDPIESFTQYVEIIMFFVISSLVGVLSDIQQAQNRQIYDANRKIRRMDRLSLLGQLSAGLAHEIRNPLGSLIGSTEIIEESLGETHPKFEFVEIMHKELIRLRDKLNEFLKFARPAPPQHIENNLNDVVRAAIDLVQKQASKTACGINLSADETLPLLLMDAEQLKQILINLLLNAIQAMPQGGTITVGTWRDGDSAGVSVEDEGAGVEIENREKIFDPFYSTKKDGTGLGLAIVKQLTEAMYGSVSVTDGASGARFEVRIPYEQTENSDSR